MLSAFLLHQILSGIFLSVTEKLEFNLIIKEESKMRITKYNLALQSEDRIPCLVKENTGNYPNISGANTPQDAVKLINTVFTASLQPEEHSYLIAFRGTRIVGVFEVSHGTTDCAIVSAKEVFSRLLLSSATAFIFLHNHPSGNTSPSVHDADITRKLIAASEIMDITFYDHLIIGDFSYYSFKDESDLFEH